MASNRQSLPSTNVNLSENELIAIEVLQGLKRTVATFVDSFDDLYFDAMPNVSIKNALKADAALLWRNGVQCRDLVDPSQRPKGQPFIVKYFVFKNMDAETVRNKFFNGNRTIRIEKITIDDNETITGVRLVHYRQMQVRRMRKGKMHMSERRNTNLSSLSVESSAQPAAKKSKSEISSVTTLANTTSVSTVLPVYEEESIIIKQNLAVPAAAASSSPSVATVTTSVSVVTPAVSIYRTSTVLFQAVDQPSAVTNSPSKRSMSKR